MPQVQRSNVIRPFVLTDRPDYVLGLAAEGDNAQRVVRLHEAWVEQLRKCARDTQEPVVTAVLNFQQNDPLSMMSIGASFDHTGTIAFRVNGVYPHELPATQAFWAAENDPDGKDAPTMQCIVCGEARPALARLQAKVKGIPGGQTAGTSIISANSEAFESYGLRESFIAPTCAACGEQFTKGLNNLLASEHNCIRMAGSAFVFWTREADREDEQFFSLLTQPRADQVHLLLQRALTGGTQPQIDSGRFFGCSLSGSGGRAVVRDWIDTTVGQVKDKLAEWFGRQTVVDPYGQTMPPLGIYALAAATVGTPARNSPPPTPRALLRAALTGAPVPMNLLYAAVRRCQAERQVTRQRAAFIKLTLTFTNPITLRRTI